MKKNEEYLVNIVDDTNLGYGIARVDSQVVFVPKVIKDESVRIAITKVQKKYAYARVLEIVKPSIQRVEPKCKVARLCGGCQLQHLNDQAQLEFKYKHLKRLMTDQKVRFPMGMENPFYYRNKAQFPVQIQKNQVRIGFYRAHSNDIIENRTCMIQSKEINQYYQFFQDELTLDMAQGLRHLFMRSNTQNKESQIVLIGKQKNDWTKLIEKCIKQFPEIKSVIFNKNTRKDNVILGSEYEVLYGRPYILESCLGNEIELHFKSFFQVNPIQMEVLYKEAIRAGQLEQDMTIVDMYAGTGTIGICASPYVKEVIGVEIVKEAVENAKRNCQRNQISNCTYLCQDATEFAHKLAQEKKKIDVVFVDPPRKGMSQQGIEDILTLNPKRIVYVSCNPQTLHRDLQWIEKKGYRCDYIQPVDMFCQTIGLECVAKIEKIG